MKITPQLRYIAIAEGTALAIHQFDYYLFDRNKIK
jgi:hypothetical protein